MACLNTQQVARISFSSDFLDSTQQQVPPINTYREAPVSSDNFEFSVTTNKTITTMTTAAHHAHADEIFFKGMLLPLKDGFRKMTLRDELLVADHDDGEFGRGVSPRLPKNSGRWKERLGLRRAQVFVPKKGDHKSGDGFVEEKKRDEFVHEETLFGKKN